ncbi:MULTISPECIES: hypothetical protein [Streptomyces]|uniref:hypothetical protein n=1 Tax=Streptomyces TaxID=1883 RepID=UPI0004C519CE|nr:hypothetical protein [Streptomyces sp. NRRL S-237]
MVRPASLTDIRVCAVADVLGPYAWRSLTSEMVSRRALAAIDDPDTTDPVPVPRHDERIDLLVDSLARCRWRSLTAEAVSRRIVTVLDACHDESRWLEIELHWLSERDR